MKVKVVIAVAVDPNRKWNAAGWLSRNGKPAGQEAMDLAVEGVDPGEARYWITAYVDSPEIKEIEGQVKRLEDTSAGG